MAALTGWDGILDDGEEILWQGAPDDGLDFGSFWSVQTVSAVFFAGFSLFWMAMAFHITSGMKDGFGQVLNIVFPLFGLPFFGAGVYMLLGRFWAEARLRRNSHYTLTNRAAYIGLDAKGKRSLERYAIGPDMRLTLEDGDLGAVWFASKVNTMPRRAPSMGRSRARIGGATFSTQTIGFERIANARAVYAMMRKLQIERAEIEGDKDA
ncbi:hypothetical protein ACEN2J_13890 [Pseudorhodobacter sp. W20_MBD10_FR17]|uniref:hypothetical protein n=1 Tax=Pseudorhodobacter sp. W20_MBD10_FR17 TaxID=3240266 RepID=UPI003F984968